MAKCDYYLCDQCQEKCFYDADIPDLFEQVGDMKVICKRCSTTHSVVVREKEHVVIPSNFNPQLFTQAPCYLCGYNGEMYYQPTKHPCAKFYHRHVEELG